MHFLKMLKGISIQFFKTCSFIGKRSYGTQFGLLNDINVLDMTRIIAGPFCTMSMSDLGANVIKVESLEGDEARNWGPPFVDGTTDSCYFLAVNRNKKSICIDVKTSDGKYKSR